MKKFTILTLVAIFAMALVGCETIRETNSNVAVVTNANATNMANITNANVGRANANTDRVTWDRDVTRDDFDRDRDRYDRAAREGGSTIGSGANDLWLWTKTRTALATTDDLRDSTINVDVDNAVVTLRGTVANKADVDRAEKAAKGVEGVTRVNNKLTVSAGDSIANVGGNTNANTRTNANR